MSYHTHFTYSEKFRIAKTDGHDRFTEAEIIKALAEDKAILSTGYIIRRSDNKIMAAPPNKETHEEEEDSVRCSKCEMPTMEEELTNGLCINCNHISILTKH